MWVFCSFFQNISQTAAVYVLYDSRATAVPAWLSKNFTNRHVSSIESTDHK